MADLAKDRATQKNAQTVNNEQLVGNAVAATKYYIGLIQVIDANNRCVNPSAALNALPGAKAGVVKDFVDNSLGANDAKKVELETGVFRFDKHGSTPHLPQDVGLPAYASDNHTISKTAADGPLVGRVWQVNSASVDVAFGPKYT